MEVNGRRKLHSSQKFFKKHFIPHLTLTHDTETSLPTHRSERTPLLQSEPVKKEIKKSLENYLSSPTSLTWQKFFQQKQECFSINSNTISAIRYQDIHRPIPPRPHQLYEDSQFPHNHNSIGLKLQSLGWQQSRASCLLGKAGLKGPCIYGALGCLRYFNKDIFLLNLQDQTINKQGFYFVKLFINGVWKYFSLDTFFPAKSDWLFTSSLGHELWPFLIQKAYVKAYGTYRKYIQAQWECEDVLNQLTGAPTESFQPQEINAVGVMKAILKNEIVALVPKQAHNHQELIHRVVGVSKSGLKVQSAWNQSKQIKFECVKKLVIVHLFPRAHHATVKLFNSQSCLCAVQFQIDSQSYLQVCQIDKRNFASTYVYSAGSILTVDQEGRRKVTHWQNSKRASIQLHGGKYKAFILIDWINKHYDFQVGIYSNNRIKLGQLRKADLNLKQAFEKDLKGVTGRASFREQSAVDYQIGIAFFRYQNKGRYNLKVEKRQEKCNKIRVISGRADVEGTTIRASLAPAENQEVLVWLIKHKLNDFR